MTATFTTVGTRFANMNGSRGNHYAHQQLMNAWKLLGVAAIRSTGCEPVAGPVTITAVVHRTTRASSDAHNVTPTIKACVDAAVAAGLIVDDNDDVVTALTVKRGPIWRVDGKARPAITLTIEHQEEA